MWEGVAPLLPQVVRTEHYITLQNRTEQNIIATGCENTLLHRTEQNRTLLLQVVRTANANVRRINQPPMEAAAEVFRNSNPKAKLSQSSDAGRLPCSAYLISGVTRHDMH